MRVCSTVGCPNLTEAGKCKGCRTQAEAKRGSAAERGYGARWRRTKARQLRVHPLCADCNARATDVHHLDGLGPKGPRGHDPSNLLSLCHSCHSKRTAAEQPGGFNRS